ncbi:MAG: translation initiation factor IF-3 [Mesoaciditoga sp.]|uniref:translation initiation factor IF-3 n=1 Tax=Athalassotoga sp. TaxID=2022597 RepID=UPI000CAAB243|nr:MAG: translation initiation factor IF-3 [Mesoaciditoga sp.]PMP80357.1 MAG: translation initiation factor IF-3 [Mesoaciditoga sp.]HEU25017.1 translation initiation factor IF-3 [Mesoaciditoga lauensis]
MIIAKSEFLKNEEIHYPTVRLIGPDGAQLGIVKRSEALQKAEEYGMDLVLVSSSSNPPVCKIMDFGKYIYEQNKKQKKSRNVSDVLKQMKFRPKIDEHDYQTKLSHVRNFIENGNKVRITIMFRGREMAFTDKGKEILDRIAKDLSDVAEIDSPPMLEGRDMRMGLRPKKISAAKETTVGETPAN